MSPVESSQLVRRLLWERLKTEPAVVRRLTSDATLAYSMELMRVTLIAVVDAARALEIGEVEVEALVSGALSRLLRDDLLALALETHHRLWPL